MTHIINTKNLQKADYILSRLLLHKIVTSPDDNYLNLYMTMAGSKTPFNYFVANITPVEKLVYELTLNDGSKQVVLPTVRNNEMGIRLKCLFNTIIKTPNELYRDILIKRIAEHQFRDSSSIKSVKAVFGVINIPSLNDYPKDPHLDFQYLYQYNFRIN